MRWNKTNKNARFISPYLITEENVPSVRGLHKLMVYHFTPGTWVRSIQVTGAGSVVEWLYEMSGQIKPPVD
jgi:hypothetical protein